MKEKVVSNPQKSKQTKKQIVDLKQSVYWT